ncbi:MAG: hypothetical protein J6S63_03400 [Atopobiaceae bacterium]|nr:hypothetical protein [Atopobiaceae bacterium]
MKDKVLLRVRLAATQGIYEFRVPFDMRVRQATRLMERMLENRVGPLYEATGRARLMYADGARAGDLLDSSASIRTLVAHDELMDGCDLALV